MLDLTQRIWFLDLPNDVHMIGHNHKGVDGNRSFSREIPKAINNDVFELIIGQEVVPMEDRAGGEVMVVEMEHTICFLFIVLGRER